MFNIVCVNCRFPYQIDMPPASVSEFNHMIMENPSSPPYITLQCPQCHEPFIVSVKSVFLNTDRT